MAWTYSNWITQTTRSSRLSVLRQHIQEVSDVIDARMSTGAGSFDPAELRAYRKELIDELTRLDPTGEGGELADSARATGAFSRARAKP